MSYSIHSEAHPAGSLIAVAGEADATATSALDDALRGAVLEGLAGDDERTIIVDLSETSFIDSRTIGLLVDWAEQLGAKGWRMPVVCTNPKLLRLFEVIGLRGSFDVFDSREAAAAG